MRIRNEKLKVSDRLLFNHPYRIGGKRSSCSSDGKIIDHVFYTRSPTSALPRQMLTREEGEFRFQLDDTNKAPRGTRNLQTFFTGQSWFKPVRHNQEAYTVIRNWVPLPFTLRLGQDILRLKTPTLYSPGTCHCVLLPYWHQKRCRDSLPTLRRTAQVDRSSFMFVQMLIFSFYLNL